MPIAGVPLAKAVVIGIQAMEAAAALLEKAQTVGKAIQTAQAEGRTHLTDAEWNQIAKTADDPIEKLRQTIAQAKAEEGAP